MGEIYSIHDKPRKRVITVSPPGAVVEMPARTLVKFLSIAKGLAAIASRRADDLACLLEGWLEVGGSEVPQRAAFYARLACAQRERAEAEAASVELDRLLSAHVTSPTGVQARCSDGPDDPEDGESA